jgi:hypothetical protein
MTDRVESFEEFWPHYVHAHRNPVNRALHYVGTPLGLVSALTPPLGFVLAPIFGYGFAWLGHFAFEKNRPATFQHPIWSLRGDFRMLGLALRGKMKAEVGRVCGELPQEHSHAEHLAPARLQSTPSA